MNNKKCLVVYFSVSGFTKKLAKELSRTLSSDIEEIKTLDIYSGFFGYQRALLQAVFNRQPQIKKLKHNPADYDLVIVGSPVWGGSISGPVRTFLNEHKDNFKEIAFFLTQGGQYGRSQVIKQMENICGKPEMANFAVSDKELNDGSFTKKVALFVSELKEKMPIRLKKDISKIPPLIGASKMSAAR